MGRASMGQAEEHAPQQYQQQPPEVLYNAILDQLIQQSALEQSQAGKMSRLVALQLGRMARANRAYGRYMMLGQRLAPEGWQALRQTAIRDAEALRPKFAGMVNACRYGDKHGLGDLAYAGLFPDREQSRASAEEG